MRIGSTWQAVVHRLCVHTENASNTLLVALWYIASVACLLFSTVDFSYPADTFINLAVVAHRLHLI